MKTSNLTQEFYSLSSESVFLTHAQIPHKHSKKKYNVPFLFLPEDAELSSGMYH
jgi:hypothetical protein